MRRMTSHCYQTIAFQAVPQAINVVLLADRILETDKILLFPGVKDDGLHCISKGLFIL